MTAELIEQLKTKRFYKFTNQYCRHHGYQYHAGPNEDFHPWNIDHCTMGGIYIADADYPFEWLQYRMDLTFVWDAEIDFDHPFSVEPNHKIKCHKIWLSNCRPISELPELRDNAFHTINKNIKNIKYMPWAKEDIKQFAVRYQPAVIQIIKNPSMELIELALYEGYPQALLLAETLTLEQEEQMIDICPAAFQFARYDHISEKIDKWLVLCPRMVKYVIEPTKEQQWIYYTWCKIYGIFHIMTDIKNLDPSIQWDMVRGDIDRIRYISNPCEEVRQYVIENTQSPKFKPT